MGNVGKVLVISLAFIGSLVIGYLAILIGFLSLWEAMGNADQNGGIAMSVAFFIAPVAGLIIGVAGAVWTKRTFSRREIKSRSEEGDFDNIGEKK